MDKILIFDCDALGWGVYHALPSLSHDSEGTAIIYGFLNSLIRFQERFEADHIVFAWDAPSTKRLELFPEYKIKRKKKKTEYTQEEALAHSSRARQFRKLRKVVLPQLGFANIFRVDGLEGDDIIASVVRKYERTHWITIIGTDNDLYQLIGANCTMYNPVKRKRIDDEFFFEQHGVYPDMWADIKAIAGCASDEVPGVPGIGHTRAIDYLLGKLKKKSKTYQTIENSEKVIKLTRRLTTLPFEGTPEFTLEADQCTVGSLKKVAREYGLGSYLKRERLKQYREAFCNAKAKPISNTAATKEER